MNRRSFLAKLGIGLLSGPAIAKAISEPKDFEIFRTGIPTQQYHGEIEWVHPHYTGFIFSVDGRPLRFDYDSSS
jgi:hypothetical protein